MTFPQPINNRLRLSIIDEILNEADITSIKVYHESIIIIIRVKSLIKLYTN